MMTLTGCTEEYFTCSDGSCVSMEQRCNGKMDCQSGSDEEECDVILTYAGYNKFLVPPPIGTETTLVMNISLNIEQIITVDENAGYFKTKHNLVRNWHNTQLTYQNLKRTASKNILSTEDTKKMWIPWTVFQNTESSSEIFTTDKKDITTIIPNSDLKFTRDDRTNIRNTMLFKGSENVIQYERESTVNWICNYNMRWYPFDTQRCTLRMFQDDSVTLKPIFVKYSVPKELTQHTVKGVHVCSMKFKNRSGVIFKVILGRPLFETGVTVHMPTGILLMLRVFNNEYLDMVIEVNLPSFLF